MTARRARRSVLAAGLLALATVTAACGDEDGVAERSAEVMPFDLATSAHSFDPTPDGLVETVTTEAPADAEQVELIRSHLAMEADAFAEGDFDDPARIHGDAMPGLAALRAAGAKLRVAYTDVANGGRITYTSTDPSVVDALHEWGVAQTRDHSHEG